MKHTHKPIAIIFLLLALVLSLHAQTNNTPPTISWQKSLGGSGNDVANCVKPTPDGGFILAGTSNSNNGDITGNHGQNDFCLIKLNAAGNLVWQHSYGGTSADEANSVVPTLDGGYAIAGKSNSHNGDITGNHGLSDYWLIKTDDQGILQWQKSYGGPQSDLTFFMEPTSDNGFVMVGTSYSNSGDVSGNHGMGDAWIVKVDQVGNLQWQKTVGGSNLEIANDIKNTNDGGYIVTGYSLSNDGDIAINKGEEDFLFFKLDGNGNLQWLKTMGGTGGDIGSAGIPTIDGGYAFCGFTHSSDLDVAGNHGGHDIWVIKTNSLGVAQWSRCLGGSDTDEGIEIKQQSDGTIIVSGNTGSTDDDVTGLHGLYDIWLAALDTSGNLLWQKTLGGSHYEYPSNLQILSVGQYIVAGKTNSHDGDVTENHGNYDFWIVKLNTPCNNIYYADADSDGYGNLNSTVNACSQPSGYVTGNTDCNDTNALIHPGANEACNGLDDNCNGTIDEGVKTAFYADADGDGYGNANYMILDCSAPSGYINNDIDCDDGNNLVNPVAVEVCNGMDDNCNGQVDENCEVDEDGDEDGDGYSILQGDCNDFNPALNPGAMEICNGFDDNCDGQIDEGVKTTFYADSDGDGYGNVSVTTQACSGSIPGGYITDQSDCDDTHSAIHPNAAEVCNGIDDNCNSQIDEGAVTASITPSGNIVLCSGSTLTLYANTGTGLTYQWKKHGSNISGATSSLYNTKFAGAFTVVVSSGSCSATSATTNVSIGSLPSATITPSGTVSVCPGNSLTINANTGNGLTYQWQKSSADISEATNSTYITAVTGQYRVIVTNSIGCSKTSAITTLNNYAVASVKISNTGSLNICSTGFVVLYAKISPGYTYQWFKDNVAISGDTGTFYTATQAGTYYYQATTSNGCSSNSANKVVTGCKLENESNSTSSLSVYPNPTNGNFNIELHLEETLNNTARIELISIMGDVILAEDADISEGSLFHSIAMKDELPDGLYFVRIVAGDQVFFQRIIYQR